MNGGHELIKGQGQTYQLVISDETVRRIMGPEPIPCLDIEMSMILNELQRKMVQEAQCVMCLHFPFQPKECKKCNKLFCKYCQKQLNGELGHNEDDFANPGQDPNDRQQQNKGQRGTTPGEYVCCPNCQESGDFLQQINKVLKNMIDFCEFPHKCWKDG